MKKNKLDNVNIATRLSLGVLVSVVGMILITGVALFNNKTDALHERQAQLKAVVDGAASLIEAYADKAKKGELTTEQAQAAAKQALRAFRYDGDNYLFINDDKLAYVLHPVRANLEGTDGTGVKDKRGNPIVVNMVELARKEGAGFTSYWYPRPGQDKEVEKMAYTKQTPTWRWYVGTGVYIDDLDTSFLNNALKTSVLVLLVIAVSVWLSIIIRRSIALPLIGLTGNMERLAQGDTGITIDHADSKSEIGGFARALMVFRENAIEQSRLQERERAEERSRAERGVRIEALCKSFDVSIHRLLGTVAQSVSYMNEAAQKLSAGAQETSVQSAAVAAASEQASTNVQTVAAASEELYVSVEEISRQVQQSSIIAAHAVEQAETTNTSMSGLSAAVGRISEVVDLINNVASQTNLLALNATIEAARAGDAGKGFAVVANEVKNLASQTSRATEEIGQQIGAVQQETSGAAAAITAVVDTIGQISQITSAIASAVEEQGAATQEIARNVQEAAHGTDEVNLNIQGVSQAANQVGEAAEQVHQAAQDLNNEAVSLKGAVEEFLREIRAA